MIRDSRCDAEISGPAKVAGKSIVLNNVQWNGIIKHLHRGESDEKQTQQTNQYNKYLQEESRAMTRTWENSVEKIREKKAAEKLREEQEIVLDGIFIYIFLTDARAFT